MDEELINNVLSNFSTFTKEEYEIINTYITKKEAEYEKKRADRIAETDVKYLVRRKYIDKYYDKALKHKELIINNAMEEFNAHKEVVLQCLSILQSLVSNPNILDALIKFLNDTWYSGQDFKEFLASIIKDHLNKMDQIHTELYNLRNCPVMFYIPELYAVEHNELKKLPGYDVPDSRLITGYRDMTDKNYPFLP